MNLFYLSSDWLRANLWRTLVTLKQVARLLLENSQTTFCLLTNFGTFGKISAKCSWKPWAVILTESIHVSQTLFGQQLKNGSLQSIWSEKLF